MLNYDRKLKFFSRLLRANQTDSEKALWSRVRQQKLMGVHFYRQKPIGKYIIDFYSPAVKLVIEVDGSQHHELNAAGKDMRREEYLKSQGLTVLRFNSREVLLELKAVVSKIILLMEEKLRN